MIRFFWHRKTVLVWAGSGVALFSVLCSGVWLIRGSDADRQGQSASDSPPEPTVFSISPRSFIRTDQVREMAQANGYPGPSLEKMKTQGCVADGLLSGYGNEDESIQMINRSECYYLHRALETWLEAPDFKQVDEIANKITKPDIVYGMFLAEAIDTKTEFFYPVEDRDFRFTVMCKPGTKNKWGEHTCIPSLERSEYRKYLAYITEQAMEHGIRSFLFGQVFLQDNLEDPKIREVVDKMREDAEFLGIRIVIGAQTNGITDPDYLGLFDYIEGGVGIDADGRLENAPCSSRYKGGWCWALLWHKRYAAGARNVFTHLDWNGSHNDDMAIFARMSSDKRYETLKSLHEYFTKKDIGFMLPMMATLPKGNGGCYGEREGYYNAGNAYSCKDEEYINEILKETEDE